jgi:hypothetical protein
LQQLKTNGTLTEAESAELVERIQARVEKDGVGVLKLQEVRELLFMADKYQSVASHLVSSSNNKVLMAIASDAGLLDITNKFDVKLSVLLMFHGNNDVRLAVNATRAGKQLRK